MAKVYCADYGCKFLNEKGVCTAKKVALSWNSVVTVNDGRKEFNTCRTKEKVTLTEVQKEVIDRLFPAEGET